MESPGPVESSPVLALDTSTHVASVALLGSSRSVAVEGRAAARSDDLIALVDDALAQAGAALSDLAGIAVGAGPGSFTGLRIGMATAKGLCFAAGLPMWTVSSLAALALDAAAAGPVDDALVVPILDVRRGEVCAGFFRVTRGGAESLGEETILDPAALARAVDEMVRRERFARAIFVGDALEVHGAALSSVGRSLAGARLTPSAMSVAKLALSGPRDDALRAGTPVYIRPSAAEVAFPEGNPGGPVRTSEKK